jgi:hypothetical protein
VGADCFVAVTVLVCPFSMAGTYLLCCAIISVEA